MIGLLFARPMCSNSIAGERKTPLRRTSLQLAPAALVALSLLLISAQTRAETERKEAVVVVAVANMYSSASQDVDVVSQAILGTDVEILEESSGWEKVRTNDAYTGWIQSSNIRPLESGAIEYAASGRVAQVSSLSANLYRETDVTLHKPVVTVPFETRVEIVAQGQGDQARWLQVRLPDGRTAWIQAGDVDLMPRKLSIRDSITLGRRFLGVTYSWGGRSSFGYDCSGFTQMLVRSRGTIMPRDADLQAAWTGAVPVNRKKLRAGDLLFFGDAPDHITHTGMFIGHGRFIHDTLHDHPGVQISRLKDQPWTRVLVACRRIK
jgi:gamma-D-glutamyl-L-lysine dipeptidyl-peptidase